MNAQANIPMINWSQLNDEKQNLFERGVLKGYDIWYDIVTIRTLVKCPPTPCIIKFKKKY